MRKKGDGRRRTKNMKQASSLGGAANRTKKKEGRWQEGGEFGERKQKERKIRDRFNQYRRWKKVAHHREKKRETHWNRPGSKKNEISTERKQNKPKTNKEKHRRTIPEGSISAKPLVCERQEPKEQKTAVGKSHATLRGPIRKEGSETVLQSGTN